MPNITIDKEKCKGCLLCISVCPKGAIKPGKKTNKRGAAFVELNQDAACLGCAMCAVICPDCCIEVWK